MIYVYKYFAQPFESFYEQSLRAWDAVVTKRDPTHVRVQALNSDYYLNRVKDLEGLLHYFYKDGDHE